VHISDDIHKVRRAQGELTQDLGREPLPDEIARRIGIPAGKVQQVLAVSSEPLSLETPIGEDQDTDLGDFIEDSEAVAPLEAASLMMRGENIESVLHTLSAREEKVF